jgi:fluoride exporter
MAQTLSARRRILAVIGGGFCGTLLRVLLSGLIQGWLGKGWPYDILLINVTGAFLLAMVTTLADATVFIGPTRRLFLNVGLCGAYTTFSSLALGDVMLFAKGYWLPALAYLLCSGLGGIVAILLGDQLGQWGIRMMRPRATPKTIHKLTGLLPSFPLDETVRKDHIDMQDDLLLPQDEKEQKAKR